MRQTQLDKNELIITHNKDRKQTKYGNKRWEHVTHAADDRLLLYATYDNVYKRVMNHAKVGKDSHIFLDIGQSLP